MVYERGFEIWIKWKDDIHPAVVEEGEENSHVTAVLENGERLLIPAKDCFMRMPNAVPVPDCCSLTHLDEANILWNLRARYANDDIYTLVSTVLLSVNPYKPLPHLYSHEVMKQYWKVNNLNGGPPHPYAMAGLAYQRMLRDGQPQAILISGESGAGKTETAKTIIKFLGIRSRTDDSLTETLQARIVEGINPVLEAFGNATTVRNDNSSRFGKFNCLTFNPVGSLIGSEVHTFLLESNRVVQCGAGERTYHVFYELFHHPDVERTLHLNKKHKYRILGTCTRKPRDDKMMYDALIEAMEKVSLRDEAQEIFQILAALIHLGEIEFEEANDNADIPEGCTAPEIAAGLLGVSVEELTEVLLVKKMVVRRNGNRPSNYRVPLTREQGRNALNGLMKTIYKRLFDYLVAGMNKGSVSSKSRSVGILDIYGFEQFDVNSLEQLCINLANESLQEFFLLNCIDAEQKAYISEGLSWKAIELPDVKPTVHMIHKIFSIMDEHGVLLAKNQKTTDERLTEEIIKNHSTRGADAVLSEPRRANRNAAVVTNGFILKHYAGKVTYDTSLWLEKNNARMSADQESFLTISTHRIVKTFALEPQEINSGKFSSVCTKYAEDLEKLLHRIGGSNVQYIRCFKPNELQKRGMFLTKNVFSQMVQSGTVHLVNVMHHGWPCRCTYESLHRFRPLLPAEYFAHMDNRTFIEALMMAFGVSKSDFCLGASKLFMKSGKMAVLEKLKDSGEQADEYVVTTVMRYIRQKKIKRCMTLVGFLIWFRKAAKQQRILNLIRALRTAARNRVRIQAWLSSARETIRKRNVANGIYKLRLASSLAIFGKRWIRETRLRWRKEEAARLLHVWARHCSLEVRLRRWGRVTVQRFRRRKELLNLFFLASKLSVEATRARKMVAVRHNLHHFARGALLGIYLRRYQRAWFARAAKAHAFRTQKIQETNLKSWKHQLEISKAMKEKARHLLDLMRRRLLLYVFLKRFIRDHRAKVAKQRRAEESPGCRTPPSASRKKSNGLVRTPGSGGRGIPSPLQQQRNKGLVGTPGSQGGRGIPSPSQQQQRNNRLVGTPGSGGRGIPSPLQKQNNALVRTPGSGQRGIPSPLQKQNTGLLNTPTSQRRTVTPPCQRGPSPSKDPSSLPRPKMLVPSSAPAGVRGKGNSGSVPALGRRQTAITYRNGTRLKTPKSGGGGSSQQCPLRSPFEAKDGGSNLGPNREGKPSNSSRGSKKNETSESPPILQSPSYHSFQISTPEGNMSGSGHSSNDDDIEWTPEGVRMTYEHGDEEPSAAVLCRDQVTDDKKATLDVLHIPGFRPVNKRVPSYRALLMLRLFVKYSFLVTKLIQYVRRWRVRRRNEGDKRKEKMIEQLEEVIHHSKEDISSSSPQDPAAADADPRSSQKARREIKQEEEVALSSPGDRPPSASVPRTRKITPAPAMEKKIEKEKREGQTLGEKTTTWPTDTATNRNRGRTSKTPNNTHAVHTSKIHTPRFGPTSVDPKRSQTPGNEMKKDRRRNAVEPATAPPPGKTKQEVSRQRQPSSLRKPHPQGFGSASPSVGTPLAHAPHPSGHVVNNSNAHGKQTPEVRGATKRQGSTSGASSQLRSKKHAPSSFIPTTTTTTTTTTTEDGVLQKTIGLPKIKHDPFLTPRVERGSKKRLGGAHKRSTCMMDGLGGVMMEMTPLCSESVERKATQSAPEPRRFMCHRRSMSAGDSPPNKVARTSWTTAMASWTVDRIKTVGSAIIRTLSSEAREDRENQKNTNRRSTSSPVPERKSGNAANRAAPLSPSRDRQRFEGYHKDQSQTTTAHVGGDQQRQSQQSQSHTSLNNKSMSTKEENASSQAKLSAPSLLPLSNRSNSPDRPSLLSLENSIAGIEFRSFQHPPHQKLAALSPTLQEKIGRLPPSSITTGSVPPSVSHGKKAASRRQSDLTPRGSKAARSGQAPTNASGKECMEESISMHHIREGPFSASGSGKKNPTMRCKSGISKNDEEQHEVVVEEESMLPKKSPGMKGRQKNSGHPSAASCCASPLAQRSPYNTINSHMKASPGASPGKSSGDRLFQQVRRQSGSSVRPNLNPKVSENQHTHGVSGQEQGRMRNENQQEEDEYSPLSDEFNDGRTPGGRPPAHSTNTPVQPAFPSTRRSVLSSSCDSESPLGLEDIGISPFSNISASPGARRDNPQDEEKGRENECTNQPSSLNTPSGSVTPTMRQGKAQQPASGRGSPDQDAAALSGANDASHVPFFSPPTHGGALDMVSPEESAKNDELEAFIRDWKEGLSDVVKQRKEELKAGKLPDDIRKPGWLCGIPYGGTGPSSEEDFVKFLPKGKAEKQKQEGINERMSKQKQ